MIVSTVAEFYISPKLFKGSISATLFHQGKYLLVFEKRDKTN